MRKTRYEQDTIRQMVENFYIYGEFVQAKPMGPGNINHTFLLTMDQGGNHVRYVLQCLNDQVFCRPDKLMENYVRVTQYLYDKYRAQEVQDISRRCIQLIHTRPDCHQAQRPCFVDADGHYWRCYSLIERAFSLEKVTRVQHARAAAAAFARFQRDLSDLPGTLHPTIPRFHDLRLRYEQLEEAVARDSGGRVGSSSAEISFYRRRCEAYCILESLLEGGQLPCRVCHNDTKISNILLDEHSGEGIAVIDLDTVMPGTLLYDFGDLGRSSLSNSTEDETDLSRICARMEYFEAMVEGFFSEWGDLLHDEEVALLAFAPKVMTLIIGLRFLTDYLNNDIYFKTHSAEHNLDRTRAHMALVTSMEQQDAEMRGIVARVTGELGLRYAL